MRLVIVVLLASCWRGGNRVTEPQPSFVARKQALAELQRNVDAFVPKLDYAMQCIVGLASEAERESIGQDLARLEHELIALVDYAADARTRGDDPAVLATVQRRLEQAALALTDMRVELRYAKTTAELEALDALSREQEETGPFVRAQNNALLAGRRVNAPEAEAVARRTLILRRLNAIRAGVQRIEVAP